MKKLLSTFMVVATLTAPAWAEGGDTFRGQAYAHGMCSSCHSIAADGSASANPAATPFKTIRMDYNSGEALSAWVNTKHPPFGPNLLNPRQAEDILAYVGTIQKNQRN